jgi:hypothetical protein
MFLWYNHWNRIISCRVEQGGREETGDTACLQSARQGVKGRRASRANRYGGVGRGGGRTKGGTKIS